MIEHDLEVGDGVIVPWGLDEVEGEVVDVVNPAHVVVAVPVEGAAGETLDTIRASYPIDVLRELPPWRVVSIRTGEPSRGADATKAWWLSLERGDLTARVEVRLSGSAAASASLPEESRRAIQTRGKSAVSRFARRFRMPSVIVIASTGVFVGSQPGVVA